jgi:hypothetical protein
MTAEADLALPDSLLVRELRDRITQKGSRTREVLLASASPTHCVRSAMLGRTFFYPETW